MKKIYFIAIILLFIQKNALAQLTVQDSIAGQQLANLLAGPEINVFNAVLFDTTHKQAGTFQYIGNDLAGINSGIILATGDINYALGPNTGRATSGPANYSIPYNDSLLSALADTTIYDYVTLEFEFEAPSDAVEFNYTFLSEEYNEIFSHFNDAFVFTISGPGIVGEENIALLPNTGAPITIKTVNLFTNWQYFNDNDTGRVNIEYDGFTSLLTARKTGLQPCQIYKISLRIADGGDRIYDSAVMLEANSLKANSITAVSSTYSIDTTALEGCIPARYTFDLGYTAIQDINIPIRLKGTALNGIDYEFIDSIITIPSGQSSSTIIVNALSDGLVEGRESIQLIYSPSTSVCVPDDTVVLYIDDAVPLSYTAIGTNLTCPEDSSGSIMLNISGGFPPYTVEYADTAVGLVFSVPDTQLPISSLNSGTYSLEVYDQYGCTADVIVSGGLFDAGQTFLPDGTGVSYTNDINITGFNVGQTLNSIQQINAICATLEHSYASDLSIELIAPNGNSIQLKGVGNTGSGVYTCNLGEPVASGPTDIWSSSNLTAGIGYQYCWSLNPTYGTMSDLISPLPPGPPPTYTYTTLAGNSYTDYYLPAGSYTPRQSFYGLLGTPLNGNWQLRVRDNFPQDNGYLFDWSISLSADLPDSIITLHAPNPNVAIDSVVNATCNSPDGAVYLTVIGNNPPYSYLWNTGATTQNILGVTAGTYTVTVTGANNCTFVHTANVSNPSGGIISDSINHLSCYNSNDGQIDLSVTSGLYTYSWSNGATSEDIFNLSEGGYTITLTDGSGCLSIKTFEILSPNPIISIGTILDENCGDQEGAIDLNVQGGTLPYTYNWSNGSSTKNIEDLQQGLYIVSVVDNNNCIHTDSFSVINLVGNCIPNCDLTITNTQLMHENCLNANGSIALTTTTTGGSLSYLWSNGTSLNQLNSLSAGIYTVTITDTRGCELVESYSIVNQTNGLTFANLNTKDDDCNNSRGEAQAVVFGGIQPYSYSWSNGETTASIINLPQGVYSCTITDASGCKVSALDTIYNHANLEPSYVNILDASCGDSTGSIDITIPGNYPLTWSILWSNGLTDADQRNIAAGVYSFVLTDSVGCEYVSPDYVIGNNTGNLMLDNIDIDHEICGDQNGEIILRPTGGNLPYSYVWSTGASSSSIQNLSSGIYSATITDSLGCTIETLPLAIGNSSGNLTIDAVVVRDEHCNNGTGSINLVVSGNQGVLTYQWSNGSTFPNISNLSAGNYVCTITDSQGCSIIANGIVSNSSGALSVNPSTIISEYCGQQDGVIDLNIQGATLPINYLWSNGATTEDITGLSQGTYQLTVTDGLGCSSISSYSIINNTGSLSSNLLSLTHEVCNNSAGEITHLATGGVPPYSYLWSNGVTSQNLTSLSAGNYYCTITDSSGCQLLIGPYLVDNSSDIVVDSVSIVDASCGLSNGAIDISINGGLSPYTYLWSNNATTPNISTLSSGNYICTITDSIGCQTIVSYFVDDLNNGLSIQQINILDETCSDGQGAINLTLQGGTLPYTYLWSNTMTSEDISSLNAGIYTISVSDALGCSVTQTYHVNNNSGNFQLTNVEVIPENCNNTQGSIEVNLNGGISPITYQWSNGAISKDILGLTAGVYTQTITDANGCILLHSVNVQNQAGQMRVNDSISLPTCGQANGFIVLNVDNGISPISYSWQNGATTAQIDSLNSGVYTCIVTDSIGCSINYNLNLQEPTAPLQILGIGTTNSVCNRANGSASSSIVGGASPYAYSWTTTANECGNYMLNMYNNSPNISVLSWNHLNYAPNMVKVTVNNSIYGYFSVSPLGGFVKNTFEQAAIAVCVGDSIKLEYVSPYPQYFFGYELLDGQGNVLFQEVQVSTTGLTYADTVKSFITGQGTPNLNGLTPGFYTLTVVDSNGCEDSKSVQIHSTSGSLNIQTQLIADETCGMQNGIIDVDIQGGILPLTYEWNTGALSEDLTNLNLGVYTLTVTDQSGCSASEDFEIMNNTNGLVVLDTLIQLDSCNTSSGAIDITVTGGQAPYSFAWSNGQSIEDLTNLSTGNYIVTITDATGCHLIESYDIHSTGLLVSSVVTHDTCFRGRGAIDLTVSGGTAPYTYLWSIGLFGVSTQDISNRLSGIYRCTITDNAGCVYVHIDTVRSIPSNLRIGGTHIQHTDNCINSTGGIYLSATGGTPPYNYRWNNSITVNSPNLTNAPYGTHTVHITDQNGCAIRDTFKVDILGNVPNFSIIDSTITPEICSNGQGAIDLSITLSGILNHYSYIWNTGETTESISGLSSGIYTVTISITGIASANNGNGCSEVWTINVPNNPTTLRIDSISYIPESCLQNNGMINIDISGGTLPYTYLWSNGDTTRNITNLSSGFYNVTVLDSIGCRVNSQSVYVPNLSYGFGIQNASIVDEQCGNDGAIGISVTGGSPPYSYLWSNGATSQNISGLNNGAHYVTITETNGCSIIDSFTINAASNPFVIMTQYTQPTCNEPNGSIDLVPNGGNPPYNYIWNTTDTTQSIFNLSIGNYSVTIEDNNGCLLTSNVNLIDTSNLVNIISVDTISTSCNSCSDGSIDLNLDTLAAPYTFLWDNGSTTEDLNNLTAGTYFVTITNSDGCTLDTSFVVSTSVGVERIPSQINAKVYPNPSDGEFIIEFSSPLTEKATIYIYNNLGQIIYTRKLEEMDLDQIIHLKLQDIISGVYLLQLTSEQKYFTQKIIIH